MSIGIYLAFDGDCKEAAELYAKAFDAETPNILPYFDEENAGRVLFTEVIYDGVSIGMGDSPKGSPTDHGDSTMISVYVDNMEKYNHIFNTLSNDGNIFVQPSEMPYAKLWAMFADKFGVMWQVGLRGE